MSYKIQLPIFEGPFDLLLFLIRKHELDIYDIPIAEITHQYLEYLELLKMLDLDIAGEFIEMVATLMLIKVRMLLPGPEVEEGEEVEDPRAELVSQLLEYQKFKEASQSLGELEHEQRQYFRRTVPKTILQSSQEDQEDKFLEDVSLFDLLTAFKQALDNMPKVTMHQVNVLKVTIEQQVSYLFRMIGDKPYVLFRDVISQLESKMELVVTFIALLDLMRLGLLTAKQSDAFGEIRLIPLKSLRMETYLKMRDKELIPDNDENNSLN